MTEVNMKNELIRDIPGRLLYEMKQGIYADADRLPPEIELAKQMGISRTLVRDCLSILEREGFINRKHGVGTVINRQVLNVLTRMDLEKEFLQMVEDAGYEAKIASCCYERIAADEQVAHQLGLKPGDEVYKTVRLITADGEPVIYCTDYISVHLIKNEIYDETLLKEPIFVFLEQECQTTVSMDVTEVSAVVADEHLSAVFHVPQGTPLLYMDEVGYEFFGSPVLYSKEYYAGGMLHHTLIRKKI